MHDAQANPSEWSFEPIEVVVEQDGKRADVKIRPNHWLLDGQFRPARGSLIKTQSGSTQSGSTQSGSTQSGSTPDYRRRPDQRGRVTVIRRPVPAAPATQPISFEADIPDVPKAPVGIPWSTLIPSVIGGLVISLLFSPLFAILAGVTAAGLIGRSLASRFIHWRRTKERRVALDLVAGQLKAERTRWAVRETSRRRSLRDYDLSPDIQKPDMLVPEMLLPEMPLPEMPWCQRLHDEDALVVHVGCGDLGIVPELSDGVQDLLVDAPGLLGQAVAAVRLPMVPIERELTASHGLAICGDREPGLSLVRSILLGFLSDIGPSDLGLAVATTPDRLADWDWVKWLPSLVGAGVTGTEIEDLVLRENPSAGQRGDATGAHRPLLLVVDGPEPTGSGGFAQAFAGRAKHVRLIWIGDSREIPAACANQVVVHPDRAFLCRDLTKVDAQPQGGIANGLAQEPALGLARQLAPFDDPELDDGGASLANRISHEALHKGPLTTDGWVEYLGDNWASADRHHLYSAIGLTRSGPVLLDLVEDGPHMLVAGTTGSGKSELLRSLIVGAAIAQPPDQVSFVLIDFKGGGAFDLVAGLPHVASVVTDLDSTESGRALQSLQAEMASRELILREQGCTDIAELGRGARATGGSGAGGSGGDSGCGDGGGGDGGSPVTLPRLLIVVDEFASLAEELPEFLDGLIDVARRGRSLGVHLVLATQRPAGVVTGQIRANTNLRICLRVQDSGDSMDVIDAADACRLPPIPGRAILSRGGSKLEMIQCAKVELDRINNLDPFVVHPALLVDRLSGVAEPDVSEPCVADPYVKAAEDDHSLESLLAACGELAPESNAAPWLDPVRSVNLAEVNAELESSSSVALGWLDDPDNRARRPYGWDYQRGGLAIIGSDGEQVDATVTTVVGGLVQQSPCHLYVLDGSGGRLSDLEQLHSVGSVVSNREPERCLKTISQIVGWLDQQEPTRSDSEEAMPTLGLVIHRWGAIVDCLESEAGPGAAAGLQRLIRDGVDRGLALVVTGSSDRDIPGRVMAGLSQRIIHRLADPAGYMAFGLHPGSRGTGSGSGSGSLQLEGAEMVDPETGLRGLLGCLKLGNVVQNELVNAANRAPAIRVLGNHVGRCELPGPVRNDRGTTVALGLNHDLAPVSVPLLAGQPVLVLGRPGSGRSTAIQTLTGSLCPEEAERVMVIDDGERLTSEEATILLAQAQANGSALVIGATPASTKGIGSWTGPLLARSIVVLINPSRADGEACRTLVPDLAEATPGRAVVLDNGRSTIVQVAA